MKQTVLVAKAIEKGDKIVGFEDVQEVASNRAFGFNRQGYVTVQPEDMEMALAAKSEVDAEAAERAEEKAKQRSKVAKKAAGKKKAPGKKKAASKKTAAKKPARKKAAAKKRASKKKTSK